MEVTGKYFLIHKHWMKQKGKKRRRKFYAHEELSKAEALARKYAAENKDDYLLVQVVREYSRPADQSGTKG